MEFPAAAAAAAAATPTSVLLTATAILPLICAFIFIIKHFNRYGPVKLPPGPKRLPIIGNIHQLGEKPHLSLFKLSKTYGPMMSLKLGSFTTVVVSSSNVAKEMFQKHDLALSSRRVPQAVEVGNHHKHSIAWLPVSPEWRNLRKVCSVYLFSTQRLDASQALRHKKVQDLIEYVRGCRDRSEGIDIGRAGFTTSLNFLSNTFFSYDLAHFTDKFAQEFQDLVWHMMEEVGKPNLADFFPILGYIDPLGIQRRTTDYSNKLSSFFDNIVKQRILTASYSDTNATTNDDVLDSLLRLTKKDVPELALEYITPLIADMFMAGTDTTSSTLEWAMTELMKNPDKMKKAQAEIDEIVGTDALVQESDIPRLPFLQAIVKETLRLHPPTVFLLPRKADSDVKMCGHLIPKDAQVLVNMYTIGRDPSTWRDPDTFCPERFLERDMDMRGKDYELIPFGAGRRICPGLPLAYRMLNQMLAALLQSFDWKLADGLGPKDLDMADKFGITLRKAKPLVAVPVSKHL